MNTVNELLDASEKYDLAKHDHKVWPYQLSFNPDSKLVVPGTAMGSLPPLQLTDWSYTQLFDRLGPTVFGKGSKKGLPPDYLLAIDPDLRAQNLNRHLSKHYASNEWLVRGYGEQARAILTASYTPVQNTDLLRSLGSAVSETNLNYRLIRSSVTENGFNVRLMARLVNTEHGEYGIGAFLRNDETGRGRVEVLPFLQRTSCENSTIFDDEDALSSTHRGSFDYLRYRMAHALKNAFKLSFDWLQRMMQAEEERIDDFNDVLTGMAKQYGWSDDVLVAVSAGTAGRQTRAAIVHGVTYAAHTAITDADEQARMEKLGGAILIAPDSLFARAIAMAKTRVPVQR